MVNRDPADIIKLSPKDVGEVRLRKLRLAARRGAKRAAIQTVDGESGRQFVEKDHYWLVAQVNNFELFKKYTCAMLDKLKTRYIVGVDDYMVIKKNFEKVIELFKKQSERCAGLLGELIIRNCDEIIAALFTDEWMKDHGRNGVISQVFRRLDAALEMFTNPDVMESDEMCDVVREQAIARLALVYVKEITRKDIDQLDKGKFKECLKRDYRILSDMLTTEEDGDGEDQKGEGEQTSSYLSHFQIVILLNSILSVPPELDDMITVLHEFKATLSGMKVFSDKEMIDITLKVLKCRDDIDKKTRNKLISGIKKGFTGMVKPEMTRGMSLIITQEASSKEWELDICVLEGKKLAPKDGTTSDPYVVIRVFDASDNVLYKTQTAKIPKTLNPRWNHMCTNVPTECKGKFDRIEFEVWDYDYVGFSNDFMGHAAVYRSEILQGIRDAALQNRTDDGTAFFRLEMEKRDDKDEVSGSIEVRIHHREVDAMSPRSPVLLPPSDAKGEEADFDDENNIVLKAVWKGGTLLEKMPRSIFSRWQARQFEIHRDGRIAWGKASTGRLEWKMGDIKTIVADEDVKRNKRFEFEIHLKNEPMLQVRASSAKSFRTWILYLKAVLAAHQDSAKKHEQEQPVSLEDFLS